MSHFTTDLQEGSIDPFLPTFDDGNTSLASSPADWGSEFFTTPFESPVGTPSDTGATDVLDDLSLGSPFFGTTSPSSNALDVKSNANLNDFNFAEAIDPALDNSQYPPIPTWGTPHPYPLDLLQQPAFTNPVRRTAQRPVPVRSSTSTDTLQSSFQRASGDNVIQQYNRGHRRSLSTNDADQIAATFGANPQFFRQLPSGQQPVGRSQRSVAANANNRKQQASRNNSFPGEYVHPAPGNRGGRRSTPTSTPPSFNNHPDNDGRRNMLRSATQAAQAQAQAQAPTRTMLARRQLALRGGQGEHPILLPMSQADHEKYGASIIEVGAMAVMNERKKEGIMCKTDEDALNMVHQVEQHLKRKDGDHTRGLKGAEILRRAIVDISIPLITDDENDSAGESSQENTQSQREAKLV